MNAPAPGWNPDPTGRHEYRYWDGGRWTDDVSDNGVTGADPVDGAPDPTASVDPTRQFTPSGPYAAAPGPGGPGPYGGPPPGAGPYGPQYGSSGGYPPAGPQKSGPSTGLIVGLGAGAVVIIALLVFFLTKDDGKDDTATDPIGSEQTDDTSSDTTASDTTDDTTTDTSIDLGNVDDDALVEVMASALESSGGLSHDQAVCASQAMLDQLGVDKLAEIGTSSDPMGSLTSDELADLMTAMSDCGITGGADGARGWRCRHG